MEQLPVFLQIIIRSLFLLILLFFLVKWFGKKYLSQLTPFDYIHGVVLGSIIAIVSIHKEISLTAGVASIATWFLIPFILNVISLKSMAFRTFLKGKSTVIIKDGKIMEDNLKKAMFTAEELLMRLRERNIFHVSDVQFALLEQNGTVTVLQKSEHKPLTPKTVGLAVNKEKEPQTVLMDGEVLLEPLANLNLTPAWLEIELEKLNVTTDNVFLAQANSDGQLTMVDVYDDKIKIPAPNNKELLMASLQRIEADLHLFSLATNNPTSKNLYKQNAKRIHEIIRLIGPYTR